MKNILIGLLVVLCIGVCVLSYTNAQKNAETSNQSGILEDNLDLFDLDTTPRNYLKNGDFYSRGKPKRFAIDTSFISNVDAAVWWYDKVLNEFPGTEEANMALRAKIRTLIGWTEGYGKDKKAFGLHSTNNLKNKFQLVESTFLELEVGYPNDEYLQALAFQIAQRYFYFYVVYKDQDRKVKCKEWFEKTIELAKGEDTFYSHISNMRLDWIQKRRR